MAKRTATRKDVAKLAGVSPTVVTYVVNDGPRTVAASTRQRVLDAIEQLGYRPNAAARALKSGKSRTYGMLVTSVSNPYQAAFVQEIDKRMGERGYSMLLARGATDLDKLHALHSDLIDRGVEGLIILMSAVDDDEWLAQKSNIPVVLLDRESPLFGHVTIGPDFRQGARIATEHLIEHGCTRIVPVQGPHLKRSANHRLQGYMEAMADAGLTPIAPVTTSWNERGGVVAVEEIRSTVPDADAVFCFSDMLGVGVLHGLWSSGVRVPDGMAVVSFDGTAASQFASPGLTSISHPISEMAAYCVESLAEVPPGGFSHRVYPVSLTRRASCGCVDTPQ
ncbi:MAG: LacI family DNA-binding transcriptional regulator [Propionicimonas sp.]